MSSSGFATCARRSSERDGITMDIMESLLSQGELIEKVHRDIADLHESAWRAFARADLEKMLKTLEVQQGALSEEIARVKTLLQQSKA